jgi:hypothetical protein
MARVPVGGKGAKRDGKPVTRARQRWGSLTEEVVQIQMRQEGQWEGRWDRQ